MPTQGQLSYLRKLSVFLDDCQQPFGDGEMVSLTDFYRNMYLLGKWKTHFLLQIHQCSKETGIYSPIQNSLILSSFSVLV